MKNIFKIACAFLCLSSLAFSAASETPDQTAARFANTLRTNIIPSLQAGTMGEPQVQQFFSDVCSSQILSKNVISDDGAFLRAATDSIGGGN